MIALPGGALDAVDDLAPEDAADDPIGADSTLAATVARVQGWGGDPIRYRARLGAGLRGLGPNDPAHRGAATSLAAIAAWRAGVIDLRDDALGRIAAAPGSAVAAVLGLPESRLASFVDAQAGDRFAWPGSGPGTTVARVGGFRGLGGRWIAAPRDAESLGGGRFRIRSGDEEWLLRADVFGTRLEPADDETATLPAVGDAGESVHVLVRTDSYLVDLVRR